MADPALLAMYVHMHWAYNYPYAARTWSIDDWRGYARGLSSLGYNAVMIWPMNETMPDPLTPSDKAFLDKIRDVIRMLHDDVGFTVWICLGPNTVGNDRAAEFTFENRPFFQTDLRLNPGDPKDVDEIMRRRRALFDYIREADGISIIDSDPGGYIGSTNAEFAALLCRYMEVFGEYNPAGTVYYWMHVGWESYNKWWEAAEQAGEFPPFHWEKKNWYEVVSALNESGLRNWGLFGGNDLHIEVAEELHASDRTLYYPYGVVEGEPTFPLTNYSPDVIAHYLASYDRSRTHLGAMANAQSHVAQLPNTYIFAHIAQGGTIDTADLAAFARGLIPEIGDTIAEGCKSLWPGDDTAKMREIAGELAARDDDRFSAGPHSDLLLGGANRFVSDLTMQLRFRAASVDVIKALSEEADVTDKLKTLVPAWSQWQARTGFNDAYGDAQGLLPALKKLGDPATDAVLRDFDDWRDPSVRHGIVTRLLDALSKRMAAMQQRGPLCS